MNKTFEETQQPNTNLSYYRIRKWIGTFGLVLPILAPLIAKEKLSSISHYYYTESGILFTSLLLLIGVFLASYYGYDKVDNIITWIGGLSIALVAIIPTPLELCCEPCRHPTPICSCETDRFLGFIPPGVIHFGSAVLFFISMAVMLIRQFTKGDPNTPGKTLYNFVYRVCGYGILLTLAFAGIMIFCFHADEDTRFIFWVEVVMLVLFATAWLLKGKVLEDLSETIDRFRKLS